MPKILVVEDELSIQKMIEYDLKQLGYTVHLAKDGQEGLEKATSEHYDIIILDLMLPLMSGFEIAEKLNQSPNKPYIMMLTAMDDEYNTIKGFDAGADDYITKPFSPRELTARVKAVLKRQKRNRSAGMITYETIEMDLDRYEVRVEGKPVNLTLKEFDLLHHFIENQGKVLSRDSLLNTLWGYTYDGDTRVVDVHIFNLREKIGILQKRIKTVRGIGYQLM
ncbi:MAG: response regulator transcription factor [Bacillota bacterium]